MGNQIYKKWINNTKYTRNTIGQEMTNGSSI